jgi:hypothetical protein
LIDDRFEADRDCLFGHEHLLVRLPSDAMERAMAGLLLLLVAVAAACGGSDDGGSAASAAEPTAEDEVLDVCRQSVEEQLKAPATAQWSDETVEALNSHGDHFDVQGHVDAENGFGALIRMVWKCDARRLSDGSFAPEGFFGGVLHRPLDVRWEPFGVVVDLGAAQSPVVVVDR